jgi:hypothetical protein
MQEPLTHPFFTGATMASTTESLGRDFGVSKAAALRRRQ